MMLGGLAEVRRGRHASEISMGVGQSPGCLSGENKWRQPLGGPDDSQPEWKLFVRCPFS